jgi:hypothetical protein
MKKLLMLFVFASFAALTNVNAQSCCAKKTASCTKSETSSATTQVAGEAMVRKVANTTEEKASCTKAKACCSKPSGKSCAGEGKTTDVTAPRTEAVKVSSVVAPAATANE